MLSKDKLWVTNASPLSLETVVTAFAACALLSVTSTEANKDTSSLRLELSIRKEIITCDTSISSNAAYEFWRAGPNFEIASLTSVCTFKRQEITNWTKRSFVEVNIGATVNVAAVESDVEKSLLLDICAVAVMAGAGTVLVTSGSVVVVVVVVVVVDVVVAVVEVIVVDIDSTEN